MIRLENVLKMSWRHLCSTSSRRFEDILKTSWTCLEEVLKILEDVLKTYDQDKYTRLDHDVLKTSSEDVWLGKIYSSWRRLLKTKRKDNFKASSRRVHQDKCLLVYLLKLFMNFASVRFHWLLWCLFLFNETPSPKKKRKRKKNNRDLFLTEEVLEFINHFGSGSTVNLADVLCIILNNPHRYLSCFLFFVHNTTLSKILKIHNIQNFSSSFIKNIHNSSNWHWKPIILNPMESSYDTYQHFFLWNFVWHFLYLFFVY